VLQSTDEQSSDFSLESSDCCPAMDVCVHLRPDALTGIWRSAAGFRQRHGGGRCVRQQRYHYHRQWRVVFDNENSDLGRGNKNEIKITLTILEIPL
jgi:hypothetical protein